MKKTLEKILNTLENCCKETQQNGKSESGEDKSKSDNQETSTKQKLFEVLSIDKRYIFDSSDEKIKEKTESVYNETIKEIKGKEDFKQRDELFSDDEKWYLICDEGGSKIDISLSYDKIKSIPCNVIFNNCNIDLRAIKLKDLKKDNAETIKNHLYFYNCTFENLLIKLKNIIFEKTLTFNQCAFYNDLDIYQNHFLDHLVFINCSNEQNDKKIISLDLQENEFKGYLFIKNCTIEKINLWKNKFKNRCYFVDSKFGYEQDEDNKAKLNFSNTHFEDEVYFNNSEFSSYADFHECKFDNIACFYGVKFYKAPNFSACYFKESKAANLINVDINELNFKSVEKYIEDNYEDESYKNETKGMQNEKEIFKIQNKHKLRYAKNLKDSFRVIKDILITQNNTLEAQEWHKLELYAKEKENHINLNVKEREKNTDIFKNILIWFNCVLLNVYRNTSDHHNDFLKILNFTVGMIALYGVFFYLLLEVYMHLDIIFIESFFRFKIIDYIYLCLFVCLTIIMFLYKNKKSIFAKSILFLTIYITFYIVYIKILNFVNITYFREWFFYLLCYIIGIYIFYLAFIFFSKFKFINFIFKLCIYLAFLPIWILSSNFINPFTGVFSSDKLYESKFEKSLNDLNTSAIINLARISQNDFNLHLKDQNISFTELNSAKALIVANKEKLKEVLSKVYNDKHVSDYKKVLSELENNTSNVKNIIEEIDNKNNNSVVSAQLNKFLKLNFSQERDILYVIKRNFSISEKLSPEQMALFDQKDSQDKLKNVLSLLKFKSRFEGVLEVINQDEIIQNTIKSTSVLYSIILLLCIFSLQKTARKNSIVPS